MAQVTVTAQYVADTAAYVRSVRQATDATNQFAKELPQVEQSQDKVKTSTIALGAALGTLGAQVFARATGAVMKYAQQGIAAAKDYEQTVISIEGIFAGTGMSMEEAATKTQGYLADLRDFAAKTPFELPQTLDAVKRLLSIGYAADDVKDRLLPTIGDIVSALGQPPSAISAVVYAFGQMKSAGRVLSQDLMQIGNALPGFNAKMAIANEMFQGDFGAMQKAMESGALNSDQAIDVIITAMQKFGGASGAMARQSETLAGVMSTFSDTVNNALIDGLMPSLPSLSAALNEVMPAVEDMATAFAQSLGPALIEGASMMGQMAPAASAIIPPLIELASQVTVLGDVFMALSPLIMLAAEAAGAMASLLSMLPDPVFAAIGAIVLFRIALKKMGIDATVASTRTIAAFKSVGAGATTMGAHVGAALLSKKIALEVAALTAKKFAAGTVIAFRAVGVAAKGLMASLGPVGIALLAAAAAMEFFMGRSAQSAALVDTLKGSVDELTGAFGEATAAAIAAQFRMDLSNEDIAMLAEMGISISDMTQAAMEGGAAADAMNAKLQGLIDANSFLGVSTNNAGSALITIQRNFQGMAGASDEARRQLEADAAARADAAAVEAQRVAAAGEANMMMNRAEALNRAAALNSMTDGERMHANFVKNKSEAMARATETAKAAIEGLNAATQALTEVMSAEATYDAARQGIIDLTKELNEGDKKLKGYSQAALDNRAAIRDAAQGYIDYANSLTDPIERQNALEEGQERIRAALEKAGIDPEKSDILQTLQQQAEQSGETVDEFARQREKAAMYGNEVGVNFIDGIIAELEANKNKVDLAAAGAVEGMPDAANDAIGAASPSVEAMKVAKNFIDGVVVGVKAERKIAEMEVSDFGQALVDALEARLSGFQQAVETAGEAFRSMREMTRGGEDMFGEPSQIMESFGETGTIGGAIGMYDQLDAMIRDAYAPFLDAEVVGKREAKRAQRAMDSARADLKAATAEVIQLMRDRQAALDEMQRVRDETAEQIQGINDRYDDLDDAANAAIKSIESKWAGIIPGLQNALSAANEAFQTENNVLNSLIQERDGFLNRISDGLRSFANELGKSTKRVVKVTKDLGDGMTVTTESEVTDVGSFRESLEARLASIREFTTNIRTLLARGLDPTLVQDFVSAGVGSAGDTVAALAGAADSELAAINSAQSSLNAEISSFQEAASAQWYDAGIAQQEAVVAPLRASAAAAQAALDQAQASRETELAAARAHAETLKNMRAAEIKAAEDARDAELKRLQGIVDNIENVELPARAAAIQAIFTNLQTTLPPQMQRVGRKAINGVIRGLNDREPALVARARQIGNSIKAALEAALQVRSPSRVTQTIGQQVAQGLIDGMKSSERSVARAATSLADQVTVPMMQPSMPSLVAAPSAAMGPMATGGVSSVQNRFEITVQSMSGDKKEIGREVVEAIRAFERVNGPVYVRA